MIETELPAVRPPRPGVGGRAWRSVVRRGLPLAAVFLLAITLAAVFAPLLPLSPNRQNLPLRLAGAREAVREGGWEYMLGADALGRSIFSRVIYGARTSLVVAFVSPLIAMLIGIPIGLLAAEFRGRTDRMAMRLADVWMSMPTLLIALSVLYLVGPGFMKTVVVLGVMRWMVFARLTRALALSVRTLDFVDSARAIGASHPRIILRHLLPNCRAELYVLMGLESARALLSESALSFLGLGIRPPESSWGTIIDGGREYIAVNPWIVLWGGFAILATTLSINILVNSSKGKDVVSGYG